MWRVEETTHDDLLGSAGMLPAVRGILPRTPQRVDTNGANEFALRAAEEPSGKMPDGAGNMPALPGTELNPTMLARAERPLRDFALFRGRQRFGCETALHSRPSAGLRDAAWRGTRDKAPRYHELRGWVFQGGSAAPSGDVKNGAEGELF